MSSNRLLSVLFLIANLFAFTNTQFADSAQCSYFNETFSGTASNKWYDDLNGTWVIKNGKLNVSQITAPQGELAHYYTSFRPENYFAIDTDVETVSLPQGGAFSIYPYTTGDTYFPVDGKNLDGIAAFLFSSGNAYLVGWDMTSHTYYQSSKYITTPTVTSIGVAYSSDAIILSINKQDTTLKFSGNFTNSYQLINWVDLEAQGTGTEVNFDNVCAGPLVVAPTPVSQTMPLPVSQEVFVYTAVETPLTDTTPSSAKPIGVGAVASKGNTYSLKADTGQFAEPVDLYLVYLYPAKDNILYCIDSNNNPTQAIVPWRTGVTSTTESLFGDVNVSLWPRGAYYVALLAMPSGGDWSSYYFWITAFEVVREFQYGTPTTHNISGTTDTSIYDPISGNTFRFPNGGNGTLTITPITSAPDEGPVSGSSFEVEYSGTDSMQLLIPHNADEVPLLWLWGDPVVSIYESPAPTETWLPLASDDSTRNPAVFTLSPSGSTQYSQPVNLRISNNPGSKIWQSKIDSTSWVFSTTKVYTDLVRNDIKSIVNLLPTGVKEKAQTVIDGRLNPGVWGYTRWGVYTHYTPFGWRAPYFVFRASGSESAGVSAVAHEVGHYMSHVLAGDDKMRVLEAQANKIHGVGVYHPGRPIVEDYAFFSDFCINQTVSGVPVVPTYLGDLPDTVDYPSKEGYATALLVMMNNKTNLARAFTAKMEEIPVINASLTDLWGILADGPLTVTELRDDIEVYLVVRGDQDKLPVLLERSGWSYHGGGHVVDSQGTPILSAVVQCVAKVPSENKEYIEPPLEPVVTNKDGYFTLPRIFPGSNYIRIRLSKDAKEFIDVPIFADPVKPTNISLDLGKLVYQIPVEGKYNYASIEFSGFLTDSCNGSYYLGFNCGMPYHGANNLYGKLQWIGKNSFYGYDTVAGHDSGSFELSYSRCVMSGTVERSPVTDEPLRIVQATANCDKLSRGRLSWPDDDVWREAKESVHITVNNVPFDSYNFAGKPDTAVFEVRRAAAAASLSSWEVSWEEKTWKDDGTAGTDKKCNLTSVDMEPCRNDDPTSQSCRVRVVFENKKPIE